MTRAGLACAIGLLLAPAAMAEPVVRSAEIRVRFTSPTSCAVDLTLDVDAREVEHRVEAAPGGRVVLEEVRGAGRVGDVTDVGRTRALSLSPEGRPYTLRYTVEQPPDRAGRCPLWIPTLPTEGRGRQVHIEVRIPAGATAAGTMPAFAWSGEEGTATIGHLPAFVRVPFALAGEPAPWNVGRVMDVVSIAILFAATLAWARRRRLSRGLAR
jgi:hypothetical protein